MNKAHPETAFESVVGAAVAVAGMAIIVLQPAQNA